jgi:phage-related protein
MSADSTVRTVLIIGLVLLLIIIVYSILTFTANNSQLTVAKQNLEDALTRITASFTAFASALFAGLSRFVAKTRDLLASFLNKISSALASALTFLANTFSQILRYVDNLASQLLTFFTTFYFKAESAITVFLENVLGKIMTLPVNIGLQITLSFVTLITNAIHTVFCFAVNGLEEFAHLLQTDVIAPIEGFFTDPNNPIIKAITGFISTYVVNPIHTVISDIENLPTTIANVFTGLIKPLADFSNDIRCFLGQVCHHTPVVRCPSNDGSIFGAQEIAGISYGACF